MNIAQVKVQQTLRSKSLETNASEDVGKSSQSLEKTEAAARPKSTQSF